MEKCIAPPIPTIKNTKGSMGKSHPIQDGKENIVANFHIHGPESIFLLFWDH